MEKPISVKELLEKIKYNKNGEVLSSPGKFTPQTRTVESKTFGDWKVDRKGNLSYDNDRYFIANDRLNNDNWIIHLSEKGWINWNDFIPAYFQACKNAKIQKVGMKMFY